MKLTFLGTGTSQGVPVIACDCAVCTSADPRDQRLRSSVMIEAEGRTFVIDTGPDFRQQMLRARVNQLDAVLFTHKHKDHIAGMDDVRAFNFRQGVPMDIYTNLDTLRALEREYEYVFATDKYPGVPSVNVHLIAEAPFSVDGIEFTPIPVMHYKMPVLGFRVGKMAYVTDANFIPSESMDLLRDLDVLVLNALRKESHISHFTLEEAVEMIRELQPKRAFLTHISHLMGLHEAVSQELPAHVEIATDGLSIEF